MIEIKKVDTKLSDKVDEYINDLTAFGWQKTENISERYGRTTHYYQILARDTSIVHYSEYVRYEKSYEEAKSKIKSYNSMEIGTVFLLLILFIVPGILYIIYKKNQKESIRKHNAECEKKMQYAVSDARNIK